jgi:hypothetical protein
MCQWCPANRSNMPWTDFTPAAAWRQELYTLNDYEAFTEKPPICELPGVNIFSAALDTLHVVDKGVACRVLGTSLWTLVQDEPNITGSLDFGWDHRPEVYCFTIDNHITYDNHIASLMEHGPFRKSE